MRTDHSDWNEGALGEELYDHVNDPNEFTNLANDPAYEAVVKQLKDILEKKISGKVPESPFNPKRL